MTSRDQPVRPDDQVTLTPNVTPSALQVPVGREQEQARPQGDRDHRTSARGVAVVGLFVLAVVYTLHVAQSLLLPIVLAVLLDFMLSPIVRWLKRFRISEPF